MKPAKDFANSFCNKHVISTRENVMEDFVRSIQKDARIDALILPDSEMEYVTKIAAEDELPESNVVTQAVRIYQLFREGLLTEKATTLVNYEELY